MTAQNNYGAGGADTHTHSDSNLPRLLATLVGATFLLGGVLGFIPGITTNADTMEFAGWHGEAKLLDLFEVSILHNIVHLLYGVAGLAMGRKASSAVAYLIGGGVIYLVLLIYGLLVDQKSDANFVPLNDADNWLHLGLGIGMIGLGMLARAAMNRTHTHA